MTGDDVKFSLAISSMPVLEKVVSSATKHRTREGAFVMRARDFDADAAEILEDKPSAPCYW